MDEVMNNILSCDKNIVIIQQNIRSMRANFEMFVTELSSWVKLPDIIILTEIWINSNEISMFQLPGYSILCNCNETYRAGGIIIFCRHEIEVEESNIIQFKTADVLRIKIKYNYKTLSLLTFYRIQRSTAEQFIDELERHFIDLDYYKFDKNMFILGDMNINLLDENAIVDRYTVSLASWGFQSLVNEPTRVTDRSSTCLDHVFARVVDQSVVDCGSAVWHAHITDHSMTVLWVSVGGRHGMPPQAQGTSYRIDYRKLECLLDTSDWSVVYNCSDASNAYDLFINILNNHINSSKEEISNNVNNIRCLKPWITSYTCDRIKKRNMLLKQVKRFPQNSKLKNYFKKYRNKLHSDIRNLKFSYYRNKFMECQGDQKKTWKVINDVTGRNQNRVKNLKLSINDHLVTDEIIVANELNNYFLTVVDVTSGNIDWPENFSDLRYKSKFLQISEASSMFVGYIHKEEIVKIICSLKNAKSPGIDGISSNMIKQIYPKIIDAFTYIINLSFKTGVFPSKLKQAVVIPLYKQNSPLICSNYRPISLLSVFSKIIEKIMKYKLLNFLSKNCFFSVNQFGFRIGMSTESALLKFLGRISEGINKNKKVSGLFLDLKKAFDLVDHTLLLEKLAKYGIRGPVLKWFRSYLLNREQCVRVQNTLSQLGTIKCGVPQGSVLGPVLFLIYVNDLCNGQFGGKLTAFADDTALCYVGDSWEGIGGLMNGDLELLKWWFSKNKMILSTEKTTYLNFSLRQNISFPNNIFYKCLDCLFNNTICQNKCIKVLKGEKVKYLGLLLDMNLNWKYHIEYLKSKLNILIRFFYMLKEICSVDVMRNVYFALVHSRIQYGITCWGGTYLSNLRPIVVQQKHIIRLMNKRSLRHPSWPLFVDLRVLPLRYVFVYKILKIFYMRSNCFHIHVNRYEGNLRHQRSFQVPKPTLTYFKNTFDFLGPRIFNELPQDIKNCQSLKLFLRKLRNWLFTVSNIEIVLAF